VSAPPRRTDRFVMVPVTCESWGERCGLYTQELHQDFLRSVDPGLERARVGDDHRRSSTVVSRWRPAQQLKPLRQPNTNDSVGGLSANALSGSADRY